MREHDYERLASALKVAGDLHLASRLAAPMQVGKALEDIRYSIDNSAVSLLCVLSDHYSMNSTLSPLCTLLYSLLTTYYYLQLARDEMAKLESGMRLEELLESQMAQKRSKYVSGGKWDHSNIDTTKLEEAVKAGKDYPLISKRGLRLLKQAQLTIRIRWERLPLLNKAAHPSLAYKQLTLFVQELPIG